MIFVYALIGWIVGIGINHAADLLPKRTTIFQPPACLVCRTPRTYPATSIWIAYLIQQQTCSGCNNTRTLWGRSFVIELITPIFFGFLFYEYGISLQLFLSTIYTTILILITVTDLEHRLIFNVVTFPAILFSIVAAFLFTPHLPWPSALVGGLFAFIVTYFLALVSRGGLGEGDVTLSTFLGLILGFPHIILSLGFGVFLGGFVAAFLLLTRQVGLRSYIPYGPFLTITGWIMLIWGTPIWQYYFY